ncbi:MAG: hypothetical protein AMS21_08760, partial [Gemmatimonas sp. SG8_38_2]
MCSPTGATDEPQPVKSAREQDPAVSSLRIYQELGFVTGDDDFPAVGNFVFLPGPADSSYVIFGLSLSNNALRFRRDQPGFVARYRVVITIVDAAAPAAWLDQTEVVRVSSFRETSRRDESVVFQGYLKLAPGEYLATVVVYDLASSSGFEARITLEVPRFDDVFITSPVIVYRAAPRPSRDAAPSLIVNPRATVDRGGGQSHLYVESSTSGHDPAIVEIVEEGLVVSTDTLTFQQGDGPLSTARTPLDASELSPGTLQIRVRRPGPVRGDSTMLVVALMPGWIVPDYLTAISHLRYAGTPTQLDSLAA